eukprot:1147447-Pelagomonas_calceolata.AAC.3
MHAAGGKVGQGAGPCHSVLREGAYAAGAFQQEIRALCLRGMRASLRATHCQAGSAASCALLHRH